MRPVLAGLVHMNKQSGRAVARPLSGLSLLHTQLRLIVPLLAIGEEHPDTPLLLATLRDNADSLDAQLHAAAPDAREAVWAGLKHAAAHEFNEARSEFLAAYHRLSTLPPSGG